METPEVSGFFWNWQQLSALKLEPQGEWSRGKQSNGGHNFSVKITLYICGFFFLSGAVLVQTSEQLEKRFIG